MTKTEKALLAGLLTLLVTSMSASLAGLHPFFANGDVDWTGAYLYLVGTALPALGAGILAYIKANPQQIEQAAEDVAQQAHISAHDINLLHLSLGEIRGLLLSQQNSAQPVTVNVAHPAPVSAPVAPVTPAPVADVAPVYSGPAPVETAANPLQGTDFSAMLQPTNPQLQAVQ